MPTADGKQYVQTDSIMTAKNDQGNPILNNMGGRCQLSRLLDPATKNMEVHGYCTYSDKADLQAKHRKLMEFAAELAEERKFLSFKAHGIDDVNAKSRLENVIAATTQNTEVLTSLTDAISEAEGKLVIAKAVEAENAARGKAQATLELAAAFRQCGQELDQSARTLGETSRLLIGLMTQLHGLGVTHPTNPQLDILGHQALLTTLAATPWAKHYPLLAPHERRSFADLIGGWATMIEARVRAQLGDEQKDEAA